MEVLWLIACEVVPCEVYSNSPSPLEEKEIGPLLDCSGSDGAILDGMSLIKLL